MTLYEMPIFIYAWFGIIRTIKEVREDGGRLMLSDIAAIIMILAATILAVFGSKPEIITGNSH